MISILQGMKAPPDMFGHRNYEDMDGVAAFLNEQAARGPPDFLPLLQECAKEFPLLNGIAIEYCEITEQAIASAALSRADREQLSKQCCNPCMVYLAEPPRLFVTDRLRQLDGHDQIIGIRHELVHLEQFVRGDTYLSDDDTQFWRGKPFNDVGRINEGAAQGDLVLLAAYLELPWEREAIERTVGLESYRAQLRGVALRMFARQRMRAPDAHPDMEDGVMCMCLMLIQNAIADAERKPTKETDEGIECGRQMDLLQFDLTAHQGTELWELVLRNDEDRTPLDESYAAPYVDKLVKTAESLLLQTLREREATSQSSSGLHVN
jgi:hypothetical protein